MFLGLCGQLNLFFHYCFFCKKVIFDGCFPVKNKFHCEKNVLPLNDNNQSILSSNCVLYMCRLCTYIWYLFVLAGIVLNIMALIDSSKDTNARGKPNGNIYYFILPIVSIVIPNPITTYITAYIPKCADFGNCAAHYRTLYTYAFYVSALGLIALVLVWSMSCCVRICNKISNMGEEGEDEEKLTV